MIKNILAAVLCLTFSGCASAASWSIIVTTNSTVVAPNMFEKSAAAWTRSTYAGGTYVESVDNKIYWTPNGGQSFAPPVGGGVQKLSSPTTITVDAGEHGEVVFTLDIGGLFAGIGSIGEKYPVWFSDVFSEALMYDSNNRCWVYCDISNYPDSVSMYHSGRTSSTSVPLSDWITDTGLGSVTSVTYGTNSTAEVMWIGTGKGRRNIEIQSASSGDIWIERSSSDAVAGECTLLNGRGAGRQYSDYSGEINAVVGSGTQTIVVQEL